MTKSSRPKIAIFAPYYGHVGTEKVMLTLAEGFAERRCKVDLLRAYQEWPHFRHKDNLRLVDLNARYLIKLWPKRPSYRLWNILLTLELLPKLSAYIRHEKPDVLITGLLSAVGVLARDLSATRTKVIISVQGLPRPSVLRTLIRKYTYPRAQIIVVPSKNIAKKLPKTVVDGNQIVQVIYNPVVKPCIFKQAEEPVKHPWFQPSQPPVILGVGRLTRQKDFQTLLKAFAIVRKRIHSRLVILGEGEERSELGMLAQQSNICQDLYMPGFVGNPYKYMSRSKAFVLSSRWEGPGHVIIEALATAVPVVSTDCPYGPRETLLDGKCGILVPVGDCQAMAEGILDLLCNPNKARQLAAEGCKHIGRFRADRVIEEYLSVLGE